MESESGGSTIKLAMRRHIQNSVAEGAEISNTKEAEAPRAGFLPRIARWCNLAWLRASDGLRNANGKVAKQFTALSERQSSTRVEVQRLEIAFRELCANVDTLHARIHELEARDRGTIPARGGAALNLNSKSQVLKLSRNGQSARTIASTLGVPVGEVEFVLKVQRLLNQAAGRRQGPIPDGERSPGSKVTATSKQGTQVEVKTKQSQCRPARVQ
jgi:hypothetical protein